MTASLPKTLNNSKGSSVAEGLIALLLLAQVTSLVLVLPSAFFVKFLAQRQAYKATLCIAKTHNSIDCRRKLVKTLNWSHPLAKVENLEVRSTSSKATVRFFLKIFWFKKLSVFAQAPLYLSYGSV